MCRASTCPTPSPRRASSWTRCGSSAASWTVGCPSSGSPARPSPSPPTPWRGAPRKQLPVHARLDARRPRGLRGPPGPAGRHGHRLLPRPRSEAGVQALQLFDTWAGVLSRRLYREFALPATAKVVQALRRFDVPVILYVNGSAPFLEETAATGVDVLSVDWRVSLAEAAERTRGAVALQGNLDAMALYGGPEVIEREVARVLAERPAAGPHLQPGPRHPPRHPRGGRPVPRGDGPPAGQEGNLKANCELRIANCEWQMTRDVVLSAFRFEIPNSKFAIWNI